MWVRQVAAVLCVVGLVIGQLLFKMSAEAIGSGGSPWTLRVLATFAAALSLYGVTSLVWVWILREIPLGRIYPLMALAFVLVPLASHFVFGERFGPYYAVGTVLIVAGIVVVLAVG